MNNVFLRALELEDYKFTHLWRIDDETWSSVVGPKRYVSLETERKWVAKAIEAHESFKTLRFVVCIDNSHDAVGLVTVSGIDNINRSCSISYMVDPELRGKKIAFKSLVKVIDYLFREVNLNRVECKILEDNIASRKTAEKVGMKEEGVLRHAVFKSGIFKNLMLYGMLQEDFVFFEKDAGIAP